MTIGIRLLRQVLALSKHRNFARAAESLHLSQPALSRSIAGLEQSLGVQLFDRTPAGVEPTTYGQTVIDRGHDILRKENELRREIFLMQGIEVGELSVGAGPFPFEISVSQAVARLIARYPKLQVRIDRNNPPTIVKRVLSGDIDIGVADIRHCEDYRSSDRRTPARAYRRLLLPSRAPACRQTFADARRPSGFPDRWHGHAACTGHNPFPGPCSRAYRRGYPEIFARPSPSTRSLRREILPWVAMHSSR